MDDSLLIFEKSGWYLILSLLFSLGISYLMYQKKNLPWDKRINFILFGLRFVVLFFVFALLLNPLINQWVNRTESPQIVIAVDNSTSILKETDSSSLANLILKLEENISNEDLETVLLDLNGQQFEYSFDVQQTNLSQQLDYIENNLEGKNLGAVVMFTDGIYNRGITPIFKNTVYPIYTVGIGDTIPNIDIKIIDVKYNKIAYQGNKFPVQVFMINNGFEGKETKVRIKNKNVIINEKTIKMAQNNTINFEIEALESGLNRFIVEIVPLDGEFTSANNYYSIYVDVVEGKENILIIAPSPHPDIRAIRNALKLSENYKTYLYIPKIVDFQPEINYDVVIVHQAFTPTNVIPENIKGDPSFWYIYDVNTDLAKLSNLTGVNIQTASNQFDKVRPTINNNFLKFKLINENKDLLDKLPIMTVPYGEYSLSGSVDIVLFQKYGSVQTSKPLLTIYEDGLKRSALLLGSGIWQWRLQEGAIFENTQFFDNLILKIVQYLSIRKDKRKFIFKPEQDEFFEGSKIRFNNELYNDVYELVDGNEINLTITDEDKNAKNFIFSASKNNNTLNIGALPEGLYNYVAVTNYQNKTLNDKGKFLIKKSRLEELSISNNHQLLKELAQKTGGKYYFNENFENIGKDLNEMDLKGIIYSSQNYFSFINLKWVILLIIILISTEWFFRKYLGSY